MELKDAAIYTSPTFISPLRILFLTIAFLFVYYTRKRQRSLNSKKNKFGPWCVVTGATDGIGKEYARQLASTGANIVLISRSLTKLGALSMELSKEFNIKVRTIQADFSQGDELYARIALGLEGLEITTLINNVGMTYPRPCYLHELDDKVCVELVNCNILSTIMMTKMVLPGMLSRGQGFIINISSMASEVSFPFLSIYAASKSFMDKFAQDISNEYASKGIVIQSLVPACVATAMSHIERPSFFAPGTEEFVRSAIASIGVDTRTPGYYSHKLQLIWFRFLGNFFPTLFQKWNNYVMNRWRLISLSSAQPGKNAEASG